MDQTLYDFLALALKLRKVERDEIAESFTALFEGDKIDVPVEVYTDDKGNRYYRDKFGFHSVNQIANLHYNFVNRLETAKRKKRMIDKYNNLMEEVLTKKTKKMIRIFLNSNHLTVEEKLEHIGNYIKSN